MFLFYQHVLTQLGNNYQSTMLNKQNGKSHRKMTQENFEPSTQQLLWVENYCGKLTAKIRVLGGGAATSAWLLTGRDGRSWVLKTGLGFRSNEENHSLFTKELTNLSLAHPFIKRLVPKPVAKGPVEVFPHGGILMAGKKGSTILNNPNIAPLVMAEAVNKVATLTGRVDSTELPGYDKWLPDVPAGRTLWDLPVYTNVPAHWQNCAHTAIEVSQGKGLYILHRDLHPGNVLADQHGLTAIVDWAEMCTGPSPAIDVSRARVQLWLLFGQLVSEQFLTACTVPHDPVYDAVVICELGDPADWLWEAYHSGGGCSDTAMLRTRMDEVVKYTSSVCAGN